MHIAADKDDYVEISPHMDASPLEGSRQLVEVPPGTDVNFTLPITIRLLRIGFQVQGSKSIIIRFIAETDDKDVVSLHAKS